MKSFLTYSIFLQFCYLFLLQFFLIDAQSFAGPFSPLFVVKRTFGNGGFEADVKVPVRGGTNGNWKMTLTFDKPVKGFQVWKGRVIDVAADFTYYVISNQPWNGYLQAGMFEFNVLGYSPHGLPSLKVTFQGQVHGQMFRSNPSAQDQDVDFQVDYNKVIELSLLFFEAQRSGKMPDDKRISWKLDSALYDGGAEGVDLTGGYYIGGDYIKFGFPMAFAVTQLAWGALEFAGGYAHASQTVHLYKAIKWGTDYFLKAHPQANVLYGMVGDPTIDHGHWESGNNINWRRPAYKITENEPGSELAAETAAALAASALLFSTVAPDYSNELLRHAEQLYLFADTHRAKYDVFSIPGAAGFYPSSGFGDELVWAAIWLHKATYKQSYLDDAVAKYQEFGLDKLDTEKGFTYDNKILAVQLLLSELTGDYDLYITPVLNFCDKWSNQNAPKTPDGLLSMPKIKNKILFVANTAFLCTLTAEETLNPTQASRYQGMVKQQISEVLGKDSGISYMVGYGTDYPKKLHDRDSSCPTPPQQCGWGFFGSPSNNAHELTGAVVGGPDDSGHLVDTRKNFVGNQPHILHNSAFQSAAAGVLYIESIVSGQSLVALDPQEIARQVFAISASSQLDACSSSPCENNGQCTSVEGFNYLCTCPDNVFGIKCEHRMTPIVKFVNTWAIGAEIKLELPELQPSGAWQLKMGFPQDCPLTELDVWNACLNVADSSLSSRVMYFQQIGWQERKQSIGIRFQFSEARFLRNCFQEAAYSFVVIEKSAPSLQWRFPEDCPKQLPHPLEGSGSGYMEPIEPVASRRPILPPDRPTMTTTTSVFATDQFEPVDPIINTITLPQLPSTPLPPVVNSVAPRNGQLQPSPTTIAPSGGYVPKQLPALQWMSDWGSGGQGQVTLEGTKPNAGGEWLLVMRIPTSCLLDSISFWEICTVESLSDPYNGVIVFEQISWQIHKSFIGFMAHFHVSNAQTSSSCLQPELYTFTYQASGRAHNRNPDTCRKEFKDIRNPSLPSAKKDDSTQVGDGGSLTPVPTPYIDPEKVWIPQNTAIPVPPVSRFRSKSSSNDSVTLAWGRIPTFVDNIEIIYQPAPSGGESLSATLTEDSLKKSGSSVTADIDKKVEVERSLTSVQLSGLLPGMRYQFAARLHAGKKAGPVSHVYVTTNPLDVINFQSVSVGGNSIELSWNEPRGIRDKYRISYFPQGRSGIPRSPFYVMGNVTNVIISGLSANTDFIVTMVTRAESIMSDGVFTFARTVPDVCASITCQLNEICENQRSGSTCVCERGYGGSPCIDIDECSLGIHVCHGNADCQNTPGSFVCSCRDGFVGDGITCYDIDECGGSPSPCPGPCLNTEGSFKCSCDPGYTGALDACTDIDECAIGTSSCPSDTTCHNTQGSYECFCPNGMNLLADECVDTDECASGDHNCSLSSICVDILGGFVCVCAKGYVIVNGNCKDLDECALGTNMCADDATCRNVNGGYQCSCNPGYHGDGRLCTAGTAPAIGTVQATTAAATVASTPAEAVNECSLGLHNCHVNSTCVDTTPSFTCICNTGYVGDGTQCSAVSTTTASPSNECLLGTHNCDVQATCVDTSQSFDCRCNNGYFGNGQICVDIDECLAKTSNCDVNSVCTNTIGSYTCTCNNGYQGNGINCTATGSSVNECLLGTHNCDVQATCIDTSQSFDCQCNNGYFGNGQICVDIDECLAKTSNCDVNSVCTNTIGSFACTCNNGYQGNGINCTATGSLVNECLLGTHNCDVQATCIDTSHSFDCRCNNGYFGNGQICVDIDECLAKTSNCDVNSVCTNTIGSFACTCNNGYQGNGINCTATGSLVNECLLATHNCDVQATCIDTSQSFDCRCNNGYFGNGQICVDIDECLAKTSNCDVNSVCTNTIGSYTCTCNNGYQGDGHLLCDDINECLSANNCHNNSTCVNTDGSFTCECQRGFSWDGVTCRDVDECAGNLFCHQDAICTNLPGSFECRCSPGFVGDGTVTCADVDECLTPQTCPQNSTCSNTQGSYTCVCDTGFTGDGQTCVAMF